MARLLAALNHDEPASGALPTNKLTPKYFSKGVNFLAHAGFCMRKFPITTAPAARILEASEATVRGLADRGLLLFERTESGVRLFEREDVERLAAKRKARRATSS